MPDPDRVRRRAPGISRRRFTTYLVAAPTLIIGGRWIGEAEPAEAQLPPVPTVTTEELFDVGDAFTLAAAPTMHLLALEITEDGRAVFDLPAIEMGQGITTTIAMMIAEELDIPLDAVDVTLADARPELMFGQLTAGSSNVRVYYQPVSRMAAAARERLRHAAADRWQLDVADLTAAGGFVRAPDGRSATFGSLSQAAAALTRPFDPAPKPVSAHTVLGTRRPRVDARDIVTGRKRFAPDLDVPGAIPAVAVHAPTMMGTLVSLDNDEELRSMPGVVDVAPVRAVPRYAYGSQVGTLADGPTAIVILADTYGQALAAEAAVRATWSPGTVDDHSDADFAAALRAETPPPVVPRLGRRTVDAEFDFAFVAHGSMETQSAVAAVREGSAEIWSGLQGPIPAKREVAEVLGLPLDAVTVHVTPSGGGFGGRGYHDVVLEAALASQATGRVVKLQWSRQQDTKTDRLRPPTFHRIRATHLLGTTLSFEHRMTSGFTTHSYGLGDLLTSLVAAGDLANYGIAQTIFRLMMPAPYDLGLTTQTLHEVDFDIARHSGAWRTIYTGTARTAEEVVVDEIAAALGTDPVAYRTRVLKDDRARRCLQWVADHGRWGRPMPAGTAQGVGVNTEHRSAVACLVELDATDPANPQVTKAVAAFDAGIVMNPSGLENQVLGGINDAISTVLRAGVHIDGGAVRESSFADFRMARQADWPTDVTVHVFPSAEDGEPGGAGETTVPAAAGAIANAWGRATGSRPRRFPLNH